MPGKIDKNQCQNCADGCAACGSADHNNNSCCPHSLISTPSIYESFDLFSFLSTVGHRVSSLIYNFRSFVQNHSPCHNHNKFLLQY